MELKAKLKLTGIGKGLMKHAVNPLKEAGYTHQWIA